MNLSGIEAGSGKKWVLVANRAGAKLYRATRRMDQLSLVQTIPFPDGRKQRRELDEDDRGSRYTVTAGRGNTTAHGNGKPAQQQKHGLDPHEDSIERVTNEFALKLSHILHDGRTHNEYDDLILVAEPHFLGRLKQKLDRETSNRVLTTINRNWIDLRDDVLQEKLRAEIREFLH